jgi:hypothetical protein
MNFQSMDVERARFNMIEQQIRTWEVLDQRVLELLSAVRREEFVPPAYRALAFVDMEIPLGHGEKMLQPKLEARMVQELTIVPSDRILEIGTGSGYMTALLARLGAHVVSVDIVPEFTRGAPPLAPLGAAFTMKLPEPALMDPWVALAQKSNLQVRIAQSSLVFATQEIARNRGAHWPTLDAFATLSESGSGATTAGSSSNDTRSAVVGLQLAVPIYQGGGINSRVREAIAIEERARQDLENARRAAEFSARQAYLGITSGTAQVRALEAALVSTQSQLSSTRLGQEVGVRTQVDVLNAQQLLFSARRDLAQSKYNYILSLLRLEAAIGELTEDDLVAVNAWLDRSRANGDRKVEEITKPVAKP